MTTFSDISYEAFKQQASEYFTLTQDRSTVTWEQAVNGNKALGLLWLGRTDDWTDRQVQESILLLELATKREMEVALVNIGNPTFLNDN